MAALTECSSDADLWQQVRQGSAVAFEVLVRRHQALVCGVAYNACGDLALSEDVAQETFWAAWRERDGVQEPGRLRAWLCGIARNLGKNARRRASRPAEAACALERAESLSASAPGPAEEAVSREEETLVWQSLEEVPEAYREPLILFYREQQRVAEVAAALDLSADAVKQRLSRGREMLRERVAELVEGVLRRSRPGRGFTVAVMAGITAGSLGPSTALAGGGGAAGVAATALTASAATGIAGGVAGTGLGLLGGWVGTWLSAEAAPTRGERDLVRRAGRRMLLVSLLFTAVLVVPILLLAQQPRRFPFWAYLVFWAAWMVSFALYISVESIRLARAAKRLRAEPGAQPNDTPLRRRAARYRGRVHRSRASFLGLPLLDVNVSDPLSTAGDAEAGRRVAVGWVAIGDDARGVLLAIGGKARGFVALGGTTVGVVSIGGVAVGLIAVGGLALGVLGIGGLGTGVWALGGLAIGWQALGGCALGWDVACGGLAVAWHAALGGAALAHDLAVGGEAWAARVNDEAAWAVFLEHPLRGAAEWGQANLAWMVTAIILVSLTPCLAMFPLLYRRDGDARSATPGA
jgi:RNA polymerase sigma factor (sigma-70 family)